MNGTLDLPLSDLGRVTSEMEIEYSLSDFHTFANLFHKGARSGEVTIGNKKEGTAGRMKGGFWEGSRER